MLCSKVFFFSQDINVSRHTVTRMDLTVLLVKEIRLEACGEKNYSFMAHITLKLEYIL